MATGHVFTGGRSRNPRFFQAKYLSPKEKTTAGKYDSLVAQLVRGRVGPAEFRHEVAKLPTFRGRKLASNPDAVLARVEQRRALEEEVLFVYANPETQKIPELVNEIHADLGALLDKAQKLASLMEPAPRPPLRRARIIK